MRPEDWSAWTRMETPGKASSVAAASYEDGHQELFVTLDDGGLVHRWLWKGDQWGEWGSLDPQAAMRYVACTSPMKGRFDVVCIDRDGGLWHRFYLVGGWSTWSSESAR
jgi:sugar lactone lactonase YvrE